MPTRCIFCDEECNDHDFKIPLQGTLCKKCRMNSQEEIIERLQETIKDYEGFIEGWRKENLELQKQLAKAKGVKYVPQD